MNWKAEIDQATHLPAVLMRLGFDKEFAVDMSLQYFEGYNQIVYKKYKKKVIKYIESLSDVEILLLTGGRTWHLKQETE